MNSFDLFANTVSEQENETNETIEILKPTKAALDLPLYNPYIPDRRIVFNNPVYKIFNASNFSIDYSYQSLDGAKVLEIGILDLNENEILSMYVLERQNKIIIYNKNKEIEKIQEIQRFVNQSKQHGLEVRAENGLVNFFVDGRIVYRLSNMKIDSGLFFVGSRNTYLEMNNVHLHIYDKKISRTLTVKEDPCELKPIYIEKQSNLVTLNPGFAINVSQSFSISKDFDYGKVFVELNGGTIPMNESLETHFWVTKDDT